MIVRGRLDRARTGGSRHANHLARTVGRDDSRRREPDDRRLHGASARPSALIDEIVRQKKRDLTVIANDTAMPGRGIGKLVDAKLRAQGDRQPHRPQSRNAAADDGRRARGGARAAGHADRAHPRRRLRARRRPDADRHRHPGRGRQAADRGRRARAICSRRRCAPTSRWCRRSLPTTSAI